VGPGAGRRCETRRLSGAVPEPAVGRAVSASLELPTTASPR